MKTNNWLKKIPFPAIINKSVKKKLMLISLMTGVNRTAKGSGIGQLKTSLQGPTFIQCHKYKICAYCKSRELCDLREGTKLKINKRKKTKICGILMWNFLGVKLMTVPIFSGINCLRCRHFEEKLNNVQLAQVDCLTDNILIKIII